MQKMNQIFTVVKLIITIIVVTLAGLLMATVLPIKGNVKVLTVLSGSMEPAIKTGSVVMIRAADSYKANDVITFTPEGRKELVTHRISAVKAINGEKIFITKGDANGEPDMGSVKRSEIQGKVWFSIAYLGYIQNWLRTPVGFVAAVVLPAAILIYGELISIKAQVVGFIKKHKSLIAVVALVATLAINGKTTSAVLFDMDRATGNQIGIATDYGGTLKNLPTADPLQVDLEGEVIDMESEEQIEASDEAGIVNEDTLEEPLEATSEDIIETEPEE